MRALAALLLVAAAAVAACSPGAQPSASSGVPASPLVGVVTAIDSSGLDQVRGFTLRTAAGQQWQFAIGRLENGDQFPPGHLGEHKITAEPVKVWFRDENGQRVAYRIEDASAAAAASASATAP